MKGYFSSLARQSSVSIRSGKASGGTLPHGPLTETVGPLHSETILFVDPTPTAVSRVHDSQTIEKTGPQVISEHARAPNENPSTSSQSGSASSGFAPPAISNSPPEARTNDTVRPVGPVETSFSITKSPTSSGIERPVRPDVALEGNPPKKGGVVRVGEPENPIEMKTTQAVESSSEGFRHEAPPVASIPHEYLEGIREWLNSAPIDVEESVRRSTSKQSSESAFTSAKDAGQSGLGGFAEPELTPQNEIQEFSLSIGSISIVVEEPAQAKPQPAITPPPSTSAVRSAPPAHDAFALTRRYFRGL